MLTVAGCAGVPLQLKEKTDAHATGQSALHFLQSEHHTLQQEYTVSHTQELSNSIPMALIRASIGAWPHGLDADETGLTLRAREGHFACGLQGTSEREAAMNTMNLALQVRVCV